MATNKIITAIVKRHTGFLNNLIQANENDGEKLPHFMRKGKATKKLHK